jgi:hypothetical protein
MVTLTTTLGTFEAETEEEALRLFRKAKREAEVARKQRELDAEIAQDQADKFGYHVYYLKHSPNANKPEWVCLDREPTPQPRAEICGQWSIELETATGMGRLVFDNDVKLVGLLLGCSGYYAIAIQREGYGVEVAAIGIHNGIPWLAWLPGITMGDFPAD